MMDRGGDIVKDLRWAAIAPAVVAHVIALAVILSISPEKTTVIQDPIPVEIVLLDEPLPELHVPETDTAALEDPDRAGLSSTPDPLLGRPEGGEIEQAEIVEDLPFEAMSGTDVAENTVPRSSVSPQNAAQYGLLGEGGDQLTAIRMALRRHACQRLVERRDPTCPAEDPFVRHLRLAELRNTPNLIQASAAVVGPESYFDRFLARNQADPINLPAGMDISLFADAMLPGAYDVQRIRDGLRPSWQTAYERDLAAVTLN